MAYINPNVYYQEDIEGETIRRKFLGFLNDFCIEDPQDPSLKLFVYRIEAENMMRNKRYTLYINLTHLMEYSESYDLLEIITMDLYRYQPFLDKAVSTFMYDQVREFAKDRLFSLSFYNPTEVDGLRDIKSGKIGKLMAIVGTITKTTEVRPELLIGGFSCAVCGAKVKDIEQQFRYTQPKVCSNKVCTNKSRWNLLPDDCVFTDWQKLRIQENSNDIPAGSMPRSIDVIIRGEQVEKGQPGDKCIFIGTPVVVPDLYSMIKPGEKFQLTKNSEGVMGKNSNNIQGVTGLSATGVRDLNYKIVFIANNVVGTENRFGVINIRGEDDTEILDNMTNQEKEEILEIKNQPNLYEKLSKSICPMVFGNDEIKKGVMLMLFGGIHKKTSEGIKLRGDINICVVGDPSTAKSQFLKYVHGFLPRSVYTSGKATSAAGLTASVQRDPETGEFTIEAGALMLADNGICCIDEFDKMDEQDQVAIHEAMEQQTISITKAGIQATLNARTSILAAANPTLGRYDKSKTLKFNLNISPPIMSRFDLFFVVCDECDETADSQIARHIVKTHQGIAEVTKSFFEVSQLQRYIRFARTIKPQITPQSAKTLRECYVRLRSSELGYKQSSYRITVRQLESLIRLSEALARVHVSYEIHPEHVKEAARLLGNSILKVHKPDLEIEHFRDGNAMNIPLSTSENPIAGQIKKNLQKDKKKVTLKADEYEQMAHAMTIYVKEETLKHQEEFEGCSKKDVITWYIGQNIQHLNNMEDYNDMLNILKAVLKRLIKSERVFIVTRENKEDDQLSLIKLHPNHAMDLDQSHSFGLR